MGHFSASVNLDRVKAIRLGSLAATLLATVLTTGCGSHSERPHTEEARPAAAAAAPAKVRKLLVVVEENHSLSQMKAGMPYTFRLAKRYGYATRYRAITHPSLPNYIAMVGGSTYGVRDDQGPGAHRLAGRTVFGQALHRGKTAATYAQSMPRRCALRNSGAYAVRHNPWTYFAKERSQCRAHDFAMGRFDKDVAAGRLPRVGLLIPDLKHDAHDGSLKTADNWFEAQMRKVFAGKDWQSGRLAVVLTADEDDRAHGNRVLTVVIHGSQDHHVVYRRLNHYSLTRLYGEVAGLPYLRKAKDAPSMARAFGLPVG